MMLPSLEKGQDQNDEKLQEGKMRGSVGVSILGMALLSTQKENVWVSRVLRRCSDTRGTELAVRSWSFLNVL